MKGNIFQIYNTEATPGENFFDELSLTELCGINDEKLTPAAARLPLLLRERGPEVSSSEDKWSIGEP